MTISTISMRQNPSIPFFFDLWGRGRGEGGFYKKENHISHMSVQPIPDTIPIWARARTWLDPGPPWDHAHPSERLHELPGGAQGDSGTCASWNSYLKARHETNFASSAFFKSLSLIFSHNSWNIHNDSNCSSIAFG